MKSLKSFMEAKHRKKMDPVDADELKGDHKDREDKDIDNDGDEDESDEYLHKRRKAIKNKVDEDVEQIDELSQETLRQYHGKAGADLRKKREKLDKGTLTSKDYKQGRNRAAGLNRAANKMEDVQIDELSKKTLGSYVKKAAGNMAGNAAVAAAQASSSMKQSSPDVKRNIKNRMTGIAKATDKMEDVQIDELSKKTLGSYARKAVADIRSDAHWKGMNQAKGNPPDVENNNRLNRRRKFTDKAIAKLAKEDVQWPVYKRLMEKTKQPNDSGIPAQPADDIASKGAKDFMAQHGDRKPEDYVDVDKVLDMNKQDMYRNLPNKSKGRPNDQKVGQPSADKSNGKDKL